MTDVFYFTGTGNSLVVARDICELLGGNLKSIAAEVKKENIQSEAELILIVFPVYNHIFPFIIQRFIDKFQNLQDKRIIAICTYGDSPGIALELLDKYLKKRTAKLSGGFGIKMPYNYVTPPKSFKHFFSSFTLRKIDEQEKKKLFKNGQKKVRHILNHIKSDNDEIIIEKEYVLIERLLDFFNLRNTLQKKAWLKIAGYSKKTDLPLIEAVQLFDHGFHTNQQCNGCGICKKICPVDNITLKNDRPQWHHRCEQCFACLQWCPQSAIQFRTGTEGGTRYHHPEIKLSDMLNTTKIGT